MLKKVERLGALACDLLCATMDSIPKRYQTPPTNRDVIAEEWYAALGAAHDAFDHLKDLANALRAKVEMLKDAPTANFAEPREPPPEVLCDDVMHGGNALPDEYEGEGDVQETAEGKSVPGRIPEQSGF